MGAATPPTAERPTAWSKAVRELILRMRVLR
jgi:hypothetical protein